MNVAAEHQLKWDPGGLSQGGGGAGGRFCICARQPLHGHVTGDSAGKNKFSNCHEKLCTEKLIVPKN